MKKSILLVGACLLLGACQSPTTQNNKTQEQSAHKLTLKEVVEKQQEASKTMKSVAFSMTTKITAKVDEEEKELEFTANGEWVLEPVAFKMKTDVFGSSMEMYYVDKQSYMKVDNNWQKVNIDETNQLDSFKNQIQPVSNEELKYMTMEEEDTYYHLKAEITDKEVIKQFMEKQVVNNLSTANLFEDGNISVDKVKLAYKVDKKTFIPSNIVINMDMSVENSGEKQQFEMELIVKYTQINEIKSIELPKEATDAN